MNLSRLIVGYRELPHRVVINRDRSIEAWFEFKCTYDEFMCPQECGYPKMKIRIGKSYLEVGEWEHLEGGEKGTCEEKIAIRKAEKILNGVKDSMWPKSGSDRVGVVKITSDVVDFETFIRNYRL